MNTTLSGNWWVFALRGIFALIFSVLAFLMPIDAIMAFAIVFGIFSIADGAMGIVAAVRKIRKGERWGWLLLSGILGILAGVVVIAVPLVATVVIASFLWASIGMWAIFVGVFELVTAIRLRKEIEGEFWMALSGIFSLLFGGTIFWMFFSEPASILLTSGWLLSVNALFSAITYFFLSYKLKKIKSRIIEVE